ncbi:Cubilin, partial [Clonorchis sinensis]
MNVSTDAQNTMPTLSIPILSHEAACSELIENEYGSVTWTSESTEKRNCDWQIRNPSGKPVLLHFKTFKVGEKSANCQGSYVSVIDVNGNTENELGKWCDTEGEDAWLMSTGSSLLIRLRTDKSVEGDKFEVTYVSTNCQFDISNNCAYISSPPVGFESVLPLKCLWRISVPDDSQMRLHFQEFNVDGNVRDCQKNALQLFSGTSGELTHIDEFCGTKAPPETTYEERHLTLFLDTDSTNTGKSFKAACSELIENEYGSVTWTSESTEKRNCDWQIRNPSGKPVLLHFKTFKVGEKSANCQGSYVSVIDVNGNTENELGKWCDTEGEDAWLMSTGSSLLIRLRTDKSVEGDKFEVTYVSTSCQFEFNDSFSYIESPPGEFVSNHPLRCLWRIRTPNDIQMWLKFREFNVGGNDENCETNGLHIFSEVSGKLAHIAEFCGSETPRETAFEQKHLTLFLNTNGENTHKMFKATCAPAACSELIENEYGSVTWTSESTEKRNCDWQIRNPSGKPVLLHFKTFKVGEKSANCQGSYVSVIDVNGNTENELGKWCDTEGEDAWLMSTGSSLLIRLRTDKSVEGDKFEVTYVS